MILLISNNETYASRRLLEEFRVKNYEVNSKSIFELFRNSKITNITAYKTLYVRGVYHNESPEFLPKVVELAKEFKKAGKRVVDANIADGFLGLGKWEDYKRLKEAGVLIPATVLNGRSKLLPFPLVAKWVYGMKARYVHLVRNEKQLEKIYHKYPKGELLVQEYIDAEWEYKVITVGYKALPKVVKFEILNTKSEKKLPIVDGKFKINYKTGIALNTKDVNPQIIELAEKASKTLGRELAKVDILEKDGKFYVLEVNRCPGFKSFEQISGFNVAGEFVRYLLG